LHWAYTYRILWTKAGHIKTLPDLQNKKVGMA
jgi:hypothetical protein